jgi:hypothetical protein
MHDKVAQEMGWAGHHMCDRVRGGLIARPVNFNERSEAFQAFGILADGLQPKRDPVPTYFLLACCSSVAPSRGWDIKHLTSMPQRQNGI